MLSAMPPALRRSRMRTCDGMLGFCRTSIQRKCGAACGCCCCHVASERRPCCLFGTHHVMAGSSGCRHGDAGQHSPLQCRCRPAPKWSGLDPRKGRAAWGCVFGEDRQGFRRGDTSSILGILFVIAAGQSRAQVSGQGRARSSPPRAGFQVCHHFFLAKILFGRNTWRPEVIRPVS